MLQCFQVEYSYPPLVDGESVDSNKVPDEWRHLASLALPDGAHNYTKGMLYTFEIKTFCFKHSLNNLTLFALIGTVITSKQISGHSPVCVCVSQISFKGI